MDISGLLKSLIGGEDLKEYDLVSSLSMDMEDDGNIILFVCDDGDGKIIEMSKEDFNAQMNDAESSIAVVSNMYFADIEGKQDYAAQIGAEQLAANAGVYFDTGQKVSGLDLENPELATKEMLPEIRDALVEVNRALVSGAAHPVYEENGSWSVEQDQQAIAAIPGVEDALNLAENALNLEDYANDLKAALPDSNVPEAIQNDIILNIDGGAELNNSDANPMVKLGQ